MKVNLWVVLLALLCFYFLFLIREDIIQNKELEKEKASLSSRTRLLLSDNQMISDKISRINNGKVIERLARERLNFTKKGEIAYKVCH